MYTRKHAKTHKTSTMALAYLSPSLLPLNPSTVTALFAAHAVATRAAPSSPMPESVRSTVVMVESGVCAHMLRDVHVCEHRLS